MVTTQRRVNHVRLFKSASHVLCIGEDQAVTMSAANAPKNSVTLRIKLTTTVCLSALARTPLLLTNLSSYRTWASLLIEMTKESCCRCLPSRWEIAQLLSFKSSSVLDVIRMSRAKRWSKLLAPAGLERVISVNFSSPLRSSRRPWIN
jgi:hypothetical protein